MKVSMIAAIGRNRELGKDNKIPWHVPEDAKWFREKTQGHVVIMGRKTYESINRPLPKRVNIVVTRDTEYKVDGCIVVHSLEEALEIAKQKEENGEVFVMGGAQIYKQGMEFADRLYITVINSDFDADMFFPEYPEFTKEVYKQEGEDITYKYTFFILEKQ